MTRTSTMQKPIRASLHSGSAPNETLALERALAAMVGAQAAATAARRPGPRAHRQAIARTMAWMLGPDAAAAIRRRAVPGLPPTRLARAA